MIINIDRMFTKKLIHLSLCLCVAFGTFTLSSCGDSTASNGEDGANGATEQNDNAEAAQPSFDPEAGQGNAERRAAIKQIMQTIPSPVEMASLIK